MTNRLVFPTKFLLTFLFLNTLATAHSLWLNATVFENEVFSDKFTSVIYFGYGHRFPVCDFLERDDLREFSIVTPNGEVKKQSPDRGGFLATRLEFEQQGLNTVTAATKQGYYTMYIKDGKMRHIFDGHQDLEDAIVNISLYYEQYAKVLIQNGPAKEFEKPIVVGHNIEIVALENPYLKREGDEFRIKVLFEGKPQRGVDIFATYVGFSHEDDFAFATKTDGEGIATIRLLERGQWIIFAIERREPGERHSGRKVFEEKYTASLTFYVK